jgi:hypothetical protein
MVDLADLERARNLNIELAAIDLAISHLEEGNAILSLVVGPPEWPVQLTTQYMTFPPQMVEGIKAQAKDRHDSITSELAGLGVTGVDPQPRMASIAAPATHTTPKRKR